MQPPDYRGAGESGPPASDSGSIRPSRRDAVRHLHAGDDTGFLSTVGAISAPHRGTDPRRIGWKPVPLHGLSENLRRRAASERGSGRCVMRAYVPEYDLEAPGTVDEVLRLIAREPGVWRPI